MQILKRAREFQSGEGVSVFESEANVREEVIRRSAKAGYCNSDGTPKKNSAGKGDRCRPMNKKKYDENYDRIFKKE